MTAYFRSHYEKISCDPFSQLWLSERTKSWCDEYLVHTSGTEVIAHAIRNRYFYGQLLEFCTNNGEGMIINLGAGFSMYPYLLPAHIKQVELDQQHVVDYKNRKTEEWENSRVIPHRQVSRLACDLSDIGQLRAIFQQLQPKDKVPTFILIEGVFFYLKPAMVQAIFEASADFQEKGDFFGAVTFQDAIIDNPIYLGLVNYFSRNGDFVSYDFTNPPHSFYEKINGYSLVKRSSVLDFGREMDFFEGPIEERELLNEYFYLLERQGMLVLK